MQAKEVKNGSIVEYDGNPVVIESISVQSPSARGAATLYSFRARNLVTKNKVDIKVKGTDILEEADFQRRSVSLMYADADAMHFMDSENFDQFAISINDLEHEKQFIREGLEGMAALIYKEECVGIQLPMTVELNVTQCDPAVKGNSATSRTKPATLETGLVVHVPEYLKEGERVKVDTRSCEYLSRA